MLKNKYILKLIFSLFFMLFFLLFLVTTCRGPDKPLNTSKKASKKELMLGVNKYLVKKDRQIIENYIERREWEMSETETGLFYMFRKESRGKSVKAGDIVTISYRVGLLDGKICYDSDSLGVKTFEVGKGGVESGLEEGVLLMRQGARARFIMPPHLAHGLIGDEDCIPPRAIIIYEVDLLEVN